MTDKDTDTSVPAPLQTPVCPAPPESIAQPEGKKFDTGKPRWSLVPKGVLNTIIKVLEFGAGKYGADNWQQVPDARRRYYDAAMRHLDAWWSGERLDPETGLPHLAHAACCIWFLLWLDSPQPLPPSLPPQVK